MFIKTHDSVSCSVTQFGISAPVQGFRGCGFRRAGFGWSHGFDEFRFAFEQSDGSESRRRQDRERGGLLEQRLHECYDHDRLGAVVAWNCCERVVLHP